MAESKNDTSVPPGTEVQIASSNERWSEFTLDDGTVIRVKASIVKVIRDEEFDPAGNPIYSIQASITSVIVKVPESLRRKE